MLKFQALTLSDLFLGLRDLTGERLLTLPRSSAVALYGPRLRAQLTQIEALPGASSGEPFADELSATDVVHDGHGGAIYYLLEAYLRSPMTDSELRAALLDARNRIVPELAELKLPYADEAANAARRQPDLEHLKALLKKVPVAGGHTLYDWCTAFLKAGHQLDELLRKRANADRADRSGAGTLRGATIGLLNRFRAALDDELSDDPAALASADNGLFAYLDTLEARRSTAPVAAPPAPPAPTPG